MLKILIMVCSFFGAMVLAKACVPATANATAGAFLGVNITWGLVIAIGAVLVAAGMKSK